MSELRPNSEQMSTSDISYPSRPRPEYWNGAAVGVADEINQPGTEIVPAKTVAGSDAYVVDEPDYAVNEAGYAADKAAFDTKASRYSTADLEGPLFTNDELQKFRSRWDQVQASFVDEPREAVRSADSLVANVVQRIAEQFAQERDQLEQQWDSGSNVSTEELRQSIKRYRALFGRLLAF